MTPGTGRTGWHPYGLLLVAGAVLGVLGSALAYLGNPPNTGICISCFLENAAGAVGLHPNPRMWYIRPELAGFLLGSFGAATAAREFRPRSRGTDLSLLGLGFLMIVGSAVFIGCPIKAVLRLAAGDLTAIAGVLGLVLGVWIGLRLTATAEVGGGGRARRASAGVALGLVAMAGLLAVLGFVPGVLLESRHGGGALHAPAAVSLGAGLLLGVLCQRSRFCITGGIRDSILTRSPWPAAAVAAAVGGAAVVNTFTGQLTVGYHAQPGAHLEWLWSLVGMGLVGVAAVAAGGCPFRQIVKVGEGDLDAAAVVVGMVFGAAVIQNWGLGATVAGVPPGGKVAVLLGWAAVFSLGLTREAKP